jgi:hypothetical protein
LLVAALFKASDRAVLLTLPEALFILASSLSGENGLASQFASDLVVADGVLSNPSRVDHLVTRERVGGCVD